MVAKRRFPAREERIREVGWRAIAIDVNVVASRIGTLSVSNGMIFVIPAMLLGCEIESRERLKLSRDGRDQVHLEGN